MDNLFNNVDLEKELSSESSTSNNKIFLSEKEQRLIRFGLPIKKYKKKNRKKKRK